MSWSPTCAAKKGESTSPRVFTAVKPYNYGQRLPCLPDPTFLICTYEYWSFCGFFHYCVVYVGCKWLGIFERGFLSWVKYIGYTVFCYQLETWIESPADILTLVLWSSPWTRPKHPVWNEGHNIGMTLYPRFRLGICCGRCLDNLAGMGFYTAMLRRLIA